MSNVTQLSFFGEEIKKENMMDTIRERAEVYGLQSLFSFEALSLLTGIKASELKEHKSLIELQEQVEMLNITKSQKIKLKAFFELATRFSKENRGEVKSVKSPQDAYNAVADSMKNLKKEVFKVILLDTKGQIIEIVELFEGGINSSIVDPRITFREALLKSATSIVCVHNHPSKIAEPSQEDVQITQKLAKIGEVMNIQVVDHIIVGGDNYVSLKERGLF